MNTSEDEKPISQQEKHREEASEATRLLERPPLQDYISDWTLVLSKEKEEVFRQLNESSLLIFRLYNEWLALPILVFSQVSETKKIHQIPQRTNAILLGLVNMRGQLKLCVNLHTLLQIEEKKADDSQGKKEGVHMLVIEKESDLWVFPVDEIYGIYRCNLDRLENVPVTISKSTANFLRGMFQHDNMSIGLLDEELLFYSLRRSIL